MTANIGKCILICQGIEVMLATMILIERKQPKSAVDEFIREFARLRLQILGALKKELLKLKVTYAEFDHLDDVIERRNWLVHMMRLDCVERLARLTTSSVRRFLTEMIENPKPFSIPCEQRFRVLIASFHTPNKGEQPPAFPFREVWIFHRSFVSATVVVGGCRSVRSLDHSDRPLRMSFSRRLNVGLPDLIMTCMRPADVFTAAVPYPMMSASAMVWSNKGAAPTRRPAFRFEFDFISIVLSAHHRRRRAAVAQLFR